MSDFLLALAAQLDAEPLDADILAALDGDGELTLDQVRRLIAWEAGQIGLTYQEAIVAARNGTLPKTALGSDIDMLWRMLDGHP